MKIVLRIILGLLSTASTLLLAQSSTKAIVNARLVNPIGAPSIDRAVIVVKGSRIDRVGRNGEVAIPRDAQVINATGKWIIPGLIDAHVHFFQSGGLYTRPDVIDLRKHVAYEDRELADLRSRLDDTFARYIRCGITGVVDVGGPFWNFEVRERARAAEFAPHVAVAGPLISTYQPEALTTDDPPIIRVRSAGEAKELVRKQIEKKTDLIKIWYIIRPGERPEDHAELVRTAIEESHRHGVRAAVHATQLETARLAVLAGADILVHSVTDREVDPEFAELLRTKKVIYTPTIVVFERYPMVLRQKIRLTAAEHALANPYVVGTLFDLRKLPAEDLPQRVLDGMKSPDPVRADPVAMKNLRTLHDAGVIIAAGTDAGNIGTLHGPSLFREFEIMAEAGLTPHQILTTATINGARLMGMEKDIGSIERGKIADLVILDADPLTDIRNTSKIRGVMRAGRYRTASEIVTTKPAEVVQQQLNAYNARDIDAFAATYAEDVQIYNFPDIPSMSGIESLRSSYGQLFDDAHELHAEVVNRIALGTYVIDQEKVTGHRSGATIRAVAVYEVTDGVIRRVWFLRE